MRAALEQLLLCYGLFHEESLRGLKVLPDTGFAAYDGLENARFREDPGCAIVPIMDEREEKVQDLKAYFASREDVAFAFLFGSQAKGHARPASDWDVGVHLVEEQRDREQEIWKAVESITETDVDLVILNRAAAPLLWNILRAGQPLAVNDRRAFIDAMFRASDEANAWHETSRRYYQIFERSASLSAEDRDRLRRLLTFLEEAVKEYEPFRSLTQQQYQSDKAAQRNVEHWIEHLVVAAADIAEIALASERRQLPTSYRELIGELGSVPPFDKDDACARIAEWAPLRNLLAHEYLDYRFQQITEFLQNTEMLWKIFIEQTKMFLSGSE